MTSVCPGASSCPVPICPPPNQLLTCPPCMPICTPVPPPCVPVNNPCPEEQPCVPCNPPQMMVCYRRPKGGMKLKSCKSRELRASVLYSGCDCEKRNGLQDDCLRSECRGSPACVSNPITCCPSQFANGKHLGKSANSLDNSMEEYQCYPAYVKMPNCCN